MLLPITVGPLRRVAAAALLQCVCLVPVPRLVAQAAPVAPARRDSVATATITGVVVDSAGRAVPHATVRVASGEPSTSTDAQGQFRLAGVPAGNARVQVIGEGYAPLGFEFAIAANVTVSLRLTLLPAHNAAAAGGAPAEMPDTSAVSTVPADTLTTVPGRTSITGLVVDSSGHAIFGATVQAISTNVSTASDSSGRFRIVNVIPGLVFVRVRKIGYLSEYFPLQTVAGRIASLTVKLRPASGAPALARVEVRADARRDARLAGFYERKRQGNGVFVEREELLRRNASNITEVLRGRTGVNIIRDANNNAVVFGRNLTGAGYCAMGVLIDGVFVNTTSLSIDQLANTQDIRAIEVYKTGPSVPSEFQRRETDCGAVLIWTR
jgi:Carboxypeptidase regulatory-like domain/TonB-dependent Receptor Plug Domain